MHADYASKLKLFGASFFDCLDFVSSNVMLPLGALTSAIFVGFVMDARRLRGLFGADMGELGFKIWYFSLRFVAPVAIVIIMTNLLFFGGK
jgi:transporter